MHGPFVFGAIHPLSLMKPLRKIAEYYLGLKTGRRQMYTVIDRDLETFKQSLEPEEWEDFKDKYNNSGVRVHVIN